MSLGFSLVDIVVIVVVLASCAYATYQGFVRETLSVFAWAAAAFATLYVAPALVPFLRPRMPTPFLGNLVAYAGVFLVVLIPLSFVSFRFSESVRNSPIGPVDRMLGFAFGVVRGFVIVGIAYLLFSLIVPVREHPDWLREARLLPLIQGSSDMLLALVPNRDGNAHMGGEAEAATEAPPQQQDTHKTQPARHVRKSYGAQDRRALDRLIEATGSGKP
jgi:membrane protein required for colicin V production